MDDIISREEIQISRRPSEFLQWFEDFLGKANADRDIYKEDILLRKGIAKVIYEEVFPLYRMLQVFGTEWEQFKFKNVIGDQRFDVEVTGSQHVPFRHIEITVADTGHEESLRMRYLLEHGSVPAIGKVSHTGTKRTGHTVHVSDDARLHTDVNREKKDGIVKAIGRKSMKDYPDDSVLLVYFDDNVAIAVGDDEEEMVDFIENLQDNWESRFSHLFIIGSSGKRGWRKERANKS